MVFLAVCAFITVAVIIGFAAKSVAVGLIGAVAIVVVVIATQYAILKVVEKVPEVGQIPEWRNMKPATIRAISEHLNAKEPIYAAGSAKLETDPKKALPGPLSPLDVEPDAPPPEEPPKQ